MTKKDDNVIGPDATEALLEAMAPVDPGEDASQRIKKRLLDRLGEDAESAQQFVTVSEESSEWMETAPGDSLKILRTDDDSMSMIVRLGPGSTFPRHYHPADEETYVIEGETWFGDIHLKAGDYHLAPKGTTHGEVRTDTGCVLFIRKATDQ